MDANKAGVGTEQAVKAGEFIPEWTTLHHSMHSIHLRVIGCNFLRNVVKLLLILGPP